MNSHKNAVSWLAMVVATHGRATLLRSLPLPRPTPARQEPRPTESRGHRTLHLARFLPALLLALLGTAAARATELSVTYSGSSEQAVIVSFFNRQTVGSSLVGTLQIENISGTWVYLEQDLTSPPTPVPMSSTIYLLGPGAIKTFPNFSFPQGSYLKLTATTPLGADFSSPSAKTTALQGALAVDLLTRGLLTFSLPPEAFDNPVGAIDPLLIQLADNIPGVDLLTQVTVSGNFSGVVGKIADIAADSQAVETSLTALLSKYVTANQVHGALGLIAQLLDLPEKVRLLTDLTAMTFSAPASTWSRMDVVAKTQAPTITSVSPTSLTTMPVPQTQPLTIHGSGFTSASRLVFRIGSTTYASRPERLSFINATTLTYNIAVGSAVGTWTVTLAEGTGSATFQVVGGSSGSYTVTPLSGPHGSISPSAAVTKAGGESQTFIAAPQDSSFTVDSWYVDGTVIPNAGNRLTLANIQASHSVFVTFKATTTTQTGSLKVTLFPVGAVSAGAQWRVDGGSYRNSGDTATSLTPGSHTVSFKAVAGYTAPADHTVTITGGAVANDSGTYTAVTASTYTLTINTSNPDAGGATASPLVSGNIYSTGAVVQLTAYANYGYHFVGWGGDLTGTANPTSITMSGNKTVTANYASGDDRLGTMILTILPPEAAAAGVQWGWNANDYRNSGSSVTSFPGTYIFTIHPVDGWIGPVQKVVTITAGQTTNVTVTFTQDTTPGLLTVTLSPPDAVTAGAKWHVNGGAAQGNGATVSLPPGSGYTVTFDSVQGWTAPPSQTVAVQRAQTTVVAGNYTPPAGKPVIVSLFPPVGAMSGGTLLTIKGVNFTASANVLIGGQPATNVTVASATQITCFTPASSVYGSTNVIVQTAGGSATNVNGFAYGIPRGSGFDLINSYGGRAYGLAVRGNYAYVGEGRTLLVMDISVPSSPSKVGRVQLPGIVSSVALFGQYAYVADGEGGLQVVDITSPAAPVVRGFYPTASFTDGVAILGGTAYVADEAAGLVILDLGNPTAPTLLASTNVGLATDVVVKTSANGVFAYVAASDQLCIVDVSQPLSPVLRGATPVGQMTVSIAISGSRVFAASVGDGLHMVDVSNPDMPVDLGLAPGISTGTAVAAANNLIYAVDGSYVWGFYVYSVSGNSLSVVGHVTGISSSGFRMAVSGNVACIAGGSSGLVVVDVANPAVPSVLTSFTDSGLMGYYGAAASFSHYLCAAGDGGFIVFDVADPALPSVLWLNTSLAMSVSRGRILVANGHAFLVDGNVKILNLANPSSPVLLANSITTSTIFAFDGAVVGNYLVLAGMDYNNYTGKLVIFDISSPSSPVQRGVMTLPPQSGYDPALCVAVSGNRAVVGMNSGAVKLIDLSNMVTPVESGQITNMGIPRGVAISSDGRYAYAVDGNANSTLRILDFSNPASPSLVTNILLDSSSGRRLEMRDADVYAATWKGLYVFGVGTPRSPALKRSYSASGIAAIALPGLGSPSDRIYLADSSGGIVALREQDIQSPDIYITNPTFSAAYTNATSSLSLGGGADDNMGVTRVVWSNSRGGGGDADGTDSWFVSGVALQPGTNLLTVTAFDQAGNSGSDTLTVIYQAPKQSQTITFPAVADHRFGDAPIPLAAAASSGLPVSFSVVSGVASLSNSVLTLTGAGSVTVRATQPGNAQFNAAPPVDVSFTVAQAGQGITFGMLADKPAGAAPFALSATASSGLPVAFSIVSGPAVLNNNIVTLTGAGAVTVRASQPGNSNYTAAASVDRSFVVTKTAQFITFGPLSRQTLGDAPFPLAASASSGLPVSFSILSGPAVLSGNVVTVTNTGLVVVRASQPGDGVYAPASPVDQSFVVAAGNNVITEHRRLPNGQFTLVFAGEFARPYVVESSTNLTQWTPRVTNLVDSLGNLEFTDSAATNRARGFYRVKGQ